MDVNFIFLFHSLSYSDKMYLPFLMLLDTVCNLSALYILNKYLLISLVIFQYVL